MMLRTLTHSYPTLCDRVSTCPSLVPPCAGKAADNQACQHFFRGTMYTAFEKLLCSTAVAGWNSDIQRQILLRLRQLVALIVDVMHEQHAHIWRLLLMVSRPLQRWLAFTSVIAAKLRATLPSLSLHLGGGARCPCPCGDDPRTDWVFGWQLFNPDCPFHVKNMAILSSSNYPVISGTPPLASTYAQAVLCTICAPSLPHTCTRSPLRGAVPTIAGCVGCLPCRY